MKHDVLRGPWALFCVLAVVVVSLPMGGAAVANHADRTLNLTPENKNNPVGGRHNMTAALSSAPDAGPITIHFEITGPGDPGPSGPGSGLPGSVNVPDGNTPETPDRMCVIDVGATECGVFYRSDVEGADEIRGWIDHDSTVEADMTEGPDENLEPGEIPEKDNTDVIKTKWFFDLPPGANLTCVPDSVNEPQDQKNTVTCTLQNSVGTKFAGWIIDAENLDGANDPDDSRAFDDGGNPDAHGADYDDACTTGANGSCRIDIPAAKREAGTAEVCFWVDEDEDSSFHATPKQDGAFCDDPEPGPGEDQGNHNTTAFAEVTWFATLHDSANLECNPEADSLPSSGPRRNHTVACSLIDRDGAVEGVRIDAEILNGVNDPDDSAPADYDDACTTDPAGTCEITIAIPDPGEDGSAEVCFWADENTDEGFDLEGERWDGGDCGTDRDDTSDVVTLEWAPTVRSVTLAASKSPVTAGRSFTLSGSAASDASDCVDGVEVQLQRALGGSDDFETVQNIRTDEAGSYSTTLTSEVSASYRAVLTGRRDCTDTASDDDRVEVRKKLSLNSKRKAVRRGGSVGLRAKVLSCTGGVTDKVVLFKRVDGVFKRIGARRTNANCVAVFSKRMYKRSVFRAHSPQDADQLAGSSRRVTVRLK